MKTTWECLVTMPLISSTRSARPMILVFRRPPVTPSHLKTRGGRWKNSRSWMCSPIEAIVSLLLPFPSNWVLVDKISNTCIQLCWHYKVWREKITRPLLFIMRSTSCPKVTSLSRNKTAWGSDQHTPDPATPPYNAMTYGHCASDICYQDNLLRTPYNASVILCRRKYLPTGASCASKHQACESVVAGRYSGKAEKTRRTTCMNVRWRR